MRWVLGVSQSACDVVGGRSSRSSSFERTTEERETTARATPPIAHARESPERGRMRRHDPHTESHSHTRVRFSSPRSVLGRSGGERESGREGETETLPPLNERTKGNEAKEKRTHVRRRSHEVGIGRVPKRVRRRRRSFVSLFVVRTDDEERETTARATPPIAHARESPERDRMRRHDPHTESHSHTRAYVSPRLASPRSLTHTHRQRKRDKREREEREKREREERERRARERKIFFLKWVDVREERKEEKRREEK